MRTSPDRCSWATTGTSPSPPKRTADIQLSSDTEGKVPAPSAIVKALVALYLARVPPPPSAGLGALQRDHLTLPVSHPVRDRGAGCLRRRLGPRQPDRRLRGRCADLARCRG